MSIYLCLENDKDKNKENKFCTWKATLNSMAFPILSTTPMMDSWAVTLTFKRCVLDISTKDILRKLKPSQNVFCMFG